MKKIFIFALMTLLCVSCDGSNGVYKKTIVDYLQTESGIKTDFKIEFQKFEVADITVADSVKILQEQYQAEKQKKVETAQKSVAHWKSAIEKQEKKGNDLVAKALVSRYQKDLENAKSELEQAENWKADYIDRYNGRPESEILEKQVDTYFSFQNPKLAQPVRQELGAVFVLSPDGTQCYKMIKNK
jgi:hypothetical protein